MTVKLLGVLVVLLSVGRLSQACTCTALHLQSAFCSTDVVVRVRITSDRASSPSMTRYLVRQITMFKGSEMMKKVEHFYTRNSGRLCGYTPKDNYRNEDYLLSGMRETSISIRVTSCNFVMPWKELTEYQRNSMQQKYSDGCECEIIPCYSKPCKPSRHWETQCIWELENSRSGQRYDYRACLKTSSGTCKWD